MSCVAHCGALPAWRSVSSMTRGWRAPSLWGCFAVGAPLNGASRFYRCGGTKKFPTTQSEQREPFSQSTRRTATVYQEESATGILSPPGRTREPNSSIKKGLKSAKTHVKSTIPLQRGDGDVDRRRWTTPMPRARGGGRAVYRVELPAVNIEELLASFGASSLGRGDEGLIETDTAVTRNGTQLAKI